MILNFQFTNYCSDHGADCGGYWAAFHNCDILADTEGARAACGLLLDDFLTDSVLYKAAFQLVDWLGIMQRGVADYDNLADTEGARAAC
jgi:hypothetical protein